MSPSLPTYSPAVPSVCRDEQSSCGRSSLCLPQADEWGEAAHLRRDRERPLRLPATGAALHASHHNKDIEYPGGSRDTEAILKSGTSNHECV